MRRPLAFSGPATLPLVTGPTLRTRRLLLRPWREADLEPFAALNADPRVMAHLPALLSRDETAAMVARLTASFARDGWGLFAVELPGALPFAGFVGLARPRFEAPFTPCVESAGAWPSRRRAAATPPRRRARWRASRSRPSG